MRRFLYHASVAITIVAMGCAGTPATQPTAPAFSPPPTAAVPDPSPTATLGSASPTASPLPATAPPTAVAPSITPPVTEPSGPGASSPAEEGWMGPDPALEPGYDEPSLVIDAAGHAHLAAVLDGGVFHLTNRSGAWISARLSTPPGSGDESRSDGEPSIALDDDGSVWVAFTRWGPETEFGRPPEGILQVNDSAGGWSEPLALVDDPKGGHSPSLALRDGELHLAYVIGVGVDVISEETSLPVRYRTGRGGIWSDVEVAPNGTAPVLQLGPDNAVHILFGDANGLQPEDALHYAVASLPQGAFAAEPIAGTSRYAAPYDLAIDPAGSPHVAWTRPGFTSADDRYAAYYQRRNGGWSEPQLLAPDATVTAIAADAGGAVHIVGSNLDGAWYASNGNATFEIRPLTPQSEISSDVAIDGAGRPHIVLVVGDDEQTRLWYGIGPAD